MSDYCAFIGTGLDAWLKAKSVTEMVICGVLTNNSVDATVRVAASMGYRLLLPSDTTAAFLLQRLDGKFVAAEDVHKIFLSTLDGECALVCSAPALTGN